MPKFNKSRGFKQTGFSYPGASPLKGKKTAQRAAAKEDLATANAKIAEFGEMKMESTDLMSDKGFSIQGGGVATPMKYKGPGPSVWSGIIDGVTKAAKSDTGKKVISSVAEAGTEALVGAAANALAGPKKDKTRKGPDVSGFSNLKFGK